MRYNLDSALVIVLRDAIRWESAVVTTAGTLTPINDGVAIDPLEYQRRDRELGFRDLVNAAAIVETSVQVSDVWNWPAVKPKLQGPATKDMPLINTTQMLVQSGNASVVRHVQNVSIALDAARYADADLYGRDALIYETLARACEDTFDDPPISRIDSQGTIFGSYGSIGWSLGEGGQIRADINAALPLGLNTFKQPDQNLADRDNQLAAYTANLAHMLKNPFEFALRIYVQVTGTDSRESEIYSLQYADVNERIWVCEPALSLRNRIVYNIADKTLQWFRESDTEVHQPQIVAMAIPGIDVGQTVTTLSSVPEGKDAQYWRSKAGQIKPPGFRVLDLNNDLTFTSDTTVVTGEGVIQPDSASLTVPGVINFTLPYALPVGQFRVSVLMQPNPNVTILGNQNITNTSGVDGGATYGTNYAPAPTAIPTDLQYRVIGGSGITYDSINYLAGQNFSANAGATTYTNIGPVNSKVNQYALSFRLALPPGPWTVEMGYTNLNGDATAFGIKGQFIAQGQTAIDVIQDAAPQPFLVGNGTVAVTPPAGFDVPYLSPSFVPVFDFPIYWTYGDLGQLGIQYLTFRSTLNTIDSTGSYVFNAGLGGQSASAYVDAENYLPEVVRFDFNVLAPVASPVFSLSWQNSASLYGQNKYIPVKLKQVQVQAVGTNYAATPLADEFQGWRQECLDRAEMSIQQGYGCALAARLTANGTLPTFRSTGSYWGTAETENWMAFVETTNPRLREVNDIPQTGYLTAGRQYEVTTAPVTYDTVVYANVGDRFYATEAGGRDYTGGVVKQVGAFMKSKPGHVGKPALMPNGLYFTSYGTVAAYYDTNLSYPVLTTCTGWMVDAGLYVAQSEFWMPTMI